LVQIYSKRYLQDVGLEADFEWLGQTVQTD
jgi:hypothetical protein